MNSRTLALLSSRINRFTTTEVDSVDECWDGWIKEIKPHHLLLTFKHLFEFDNNTFMQAIEDINSTPIDEYDDFISAILYRAAQLKIAYEIEYRSEININEDA